MISAQFVVPTRKKSFGKGEKKLVRTSGLPLEGSSSDKCPHLVVQKKFKKVKKKLVRVLEI
jgi:hypothetical protein